MEAKDTVKYPKNSQILPEIAIYQNALLLEQAKISFKAGIREVVEWTEEHKGHPQGSTLSPDYSLYLGYEWRAKLKEWGIDV